jgi:hypothetical protein
MALMPVLHLCGAIFVGACLNRTIDAESVNPQGTPMNNTWTVIRHSGGIMELERQGEILEIQRPSDPVTRLAFMRAQEGDSIDNGVVRLLLGKK